MTVKSVFPNIYRIFNIILTLPFTTAGVERSFSMLKRIFDEKRSSMKTERLCNLGIISYYHSMSTRARIHERPVTRNSRTWACYRVFLASPRKSCYTKFRVYFVVATCFVLKWKKFVYRVVYRPKFRAQCQLNLILMR